MSQVPTWNPGSFAWRELNTTDLERSVEFYTKLVGWTVEYMDMGTFQYPIVQANGRGVGGIMQLPPGVQGPPHWAQYVSVPDVDEAAAAARAAGGQVLHGPEDIPGVGRFCVVMDPRGGVIYPFKGANGDAPWCTPGLGDFCWDALNSTDIAAAQAFYTAVLPWTAGGFQGMPTFNAPNGNSVASLAPAPAGVPDHWLTYIVVADLAAANARVVELGGQVVVPAIPVPTVGTFSVIRDNVGAYVCLFVGEQKA